MLSILYYHKYIFIRIWIAYQILIKVMKSYALQAHTHTCLYARICMPIDTYTELHSATYIINFKT
jgi:hypothetical protein